VALEIQNAQVCGGERFLLVRLGKDRSDGMRWYSSVEK
jgi:hypothetical protein